MKSLPERWRWWRIDLVGAAVMVALALVVGLGGFWPLVRDHREQARDQAEMIAQREQAARLEAGLVMLRTRVDAVHDALEREALHLRPASALNRHLTDISSLAVESGLRIDDIRPDSIVSGTQYETVPIVMAGGGSYRTCTAFLGRMRTAMPDTSISALELSANPADAGTSGKFRFELSWYAAPKGAAASTQERTSARAGE